MEVSEGIKKLSGKEGNLTDLVKEYLDVKKAHYTRIDADPGEKVARLKGIDPFVEPGSIMLEKEGKKFIIEELTKVCGVSGRYHDTGGKTSVHAILDKVPRILFKTYQDKKDMHVYAEAELKEPTFGLYIGGGKITVDMEDILKEPSNIPDFTETYEINCKCDEGKLKCKGNAWQY